MARRILELAQQAGLKANARLTETGLAEELGVSRSPVRAALALLQEQGVVRLAPKQGYFLCCDATGAAFEAVQLPRSAEETIYRDLLSARFANLIPEQVSASDIMRRYGIDRASVTRLLSRMIEEGVVERAAGRGYIFVPVLNEPEAFRDSYRFRLLIEPAAILEPGFSPDPRRIAAIRARHAELMAGAVDTAPMIELFEADAEFHEAIGDFSGNRFLRQAIHLQTHLRRLSEYESHYDRQRLRRSCEEHLAILDAIAAGERERAADLMREHIRISEQVEPDFRKVRALTHRRLTRM